LLNYWESSTEKALKENATLLKEVAGTARAALGSTNSGNTDQLGNKITTGISHQLKNQAINKTESFVGTRPPRAIFAIGVGIGL
jgi:ElaB/YqjD/DUF883 family membrane-anchored ribosome-binding protein